MKSVLAFYKFLEIPDLEDLRFDLLDQGAFLDLKGTILIAHEGINSTLVGNKKNLEKFSVWLTDRFGCFPFKWSSAESSNEVFFRFKVKIKPEIVTMGVNELDMRSVGRHVLIDEWNELLEDPNVIVVDARNEYETDIGGFPGSITPRTKSFRDFPAWADKELNAKENSRIAMFCTGGIRCEKASAYLINRGFKDVCQLEGGVLKYLENAEEENNRWSGECFVFDQRVSVNARLEQGCYYQCFACRHPLSESDLSSEFYEEGVSCHFCIDSKSLERKDQFRQRQKQIQLANERGHQHIGITKN